MGPQEGNVVEMARPVTKYALILLDPKKARYELEKALYLAVSGRPWPVWLDIPLDIQGADIDVATLEAFTPPETEVVPGLMEQARQFLQIASSPARRPLFLPGNGIHIAHAEGLLGELLERMPFPVVLPNCAKDLAPSFTQEDGGVFGTAGQRRVNFTVQNDR